MDDTEQTEQAQPEWRWHRPLWGHKSHLVLIAASGWPYTPTACGWSVCNDWPNNDASNPCKRCLRSAAGKLVGSDPSPNPRPRLSLYGLWADLGSAPTEEEIAASRRDMWSTPEEEEAQP